MTEQELQELLKKTSKSLEPTVHYLLGRNLSNAAVTIANWLKTNPTIKTLYLILSEFGDNGTKALAETLRDNNILQELNLEGNQIGDDGAKALAEALRVNNVLQQLNLGSNQIGDNGAKDIAEALKVNSTLHKLHLNRNKIGDGGAKDIAEALKVNNVLQQLDLENYQIGDDGAKALAEALRVNNVLQQLNLGSNQIGDNGAKALAEALRVNNVLQQLDLGSNQIGDNGAKDIAEALRVNNALHFLHLGGNQISYDEATNEYIAQVLRTNYIITLINFGSTISIEEILVRNKNLIQVFAKTFKDYPVDKPLPWQALSYLKRCDKERLEEELQKQGHQNPKDFIEQHGVQKFSSVGAVLQQLGISKILTKKATNTETWIGSLPAEILKVIFSIAYPKLVFVLDKNFRFKESESNKNVLEQPHKFPTDQTPTDEIEPSGVVEVSDDQA